MRAAAVACMCFVLLVGNSDGFRMGGVVIKRPATVSKSSSTSLAARRLAFGGRGDVQQVSQVIGGAMPASAQNLAVSLDEPLMATRYLQPGRTGMSLPALIGLSLKLAVAYLVFQVTLALTRLTIDALLGEDSGNEPALRVVGPSILGKLGSFVGAVTYSLKVGGRWALSPLAKVAPEVVHFWRLLWGRVARVIDFYQAKTRPVSEELDLSGDEWGVSTLVSKEPIGEAGYVRYTFKIPEGKVLPLDMAQQLTLCCLDAGSNVAKSDFFVSSARHVAGKFEIVATRGAKKDEAVLGRESAAFHSVLYEQMEVGDEVAIKPGKSTLEYRGQDLPVTDMVYLCNGLGVVPIINQVKELVGVQSSTVQTLSVVWINEKPEEFYKGAYNELEDEFYKYNKKLDVSCCLANDVYAGAMSDNEEIVTSVPDFQPGTMAVLAGPDYFVKKANMFLQSKGYPADCI
eukprot:CAMPEP_0182510064 /NCGR_PEP_ID=MMETSP1321-20130603/27930_1 /TAXON_ID=91990 /ORGANISM="Bolidomonas sp., Strain RCC1657" /LENGTH=457 /DNA_ID=CAMNT_0024716467 /DNA_START=143 /DNA_END=1513 /DNA_ORIENTATION=-